MPMRRYVLGLLLFTVFAQNSIGQDALAQKNSADKVQAGENEPSFDDLWTPKPATHPDAEPWETFTDKDWYDDRFRKMDTGPFFSHSIKVPGIGMIPKAIAVKLDHGGHAIFDTEQCGIRAVWTGDFLDLKPKRFGLLEMPDVAGDVGALTSAKHLWNQKSSDDWRPVSADQIQYKGLKLWGDNVVLKYVIGDRIFAENSQFDATKDRKSWTYYRTLEFGPSETSQRLCVLEFPNAVQKTAGFEQEGEIYSVSATSPAGTYDIMLPGNIGVSVDENNVSLRREGQQLFLEFGPSKNQHTNITLAISFDARNSESAGIATRRDELHEWDELFRRNWRQIITVQGELGPDGGPFAVDTITVPYKNPFNALMFTSGLDFMPDGSLMVCMAHGDVWKVTGVDQALKKVTWQRFATGLYQPLGLKVRDGDIFVLGRDQITRLQDKNNDGEADFYECFNNDLKVFGQPHAYAMCLEMDPQGNFYFLKSGRGQKPHGGSLLKVSADGKTLTRFASGFRHPNGLGVGPDGQITAADNEGNWIPKTRIDWAKQDGFYGYMPTHQREKEPATYDLPICWVPRSFDNSAGGQVWVPKDHWGPYAGQLLHLSYGRCWPLLVLHEEVDGVKQGGTVRFPVSRMLSGTMRGRFHPDDGHLYLTGLDGWQTAAVRDGCLHRIRRTGEPILTPISLNACKNGIKIGFGELLDRNFVEDVARFNVEVWGYRWTKDYGSKDYRVSRPQEEGHDRIPIRSVKLLQDGKTVFLEIPSIRPVMQMGIQGTLKTVTGEKFALQLYNTIHKLGKAQKK